jgi:hypothetical protein
MRVTSVRIALLAAIGVSAWSVPALAEQNFDQAGISVSRAAALNNNVTEPALAKPAKPQFEKINANLALNKSTYVYRIPRILGVFR